jgi:uncharacterized protein (TIGR03435 family)
MTLKYLSALWTALAPALGNHLWQSTLFAITAGLLTLILRKNQARARYWVWLAASVKFLIPFSLLVGVGSHLSWSRGSAGTNAGLYFAMEQVTQPFSQAVMPVVSRSAPSTVFESLLHLLPALLTATWLCGFALVVFVWYTRWRRISATVRESVPLRNGREVEALRCQERVAGIRIRMEIRLSRASLEPGIFGILRPVLVWPQGISERLDDGHLEAILAHEVWHVRSRDNLAAAIHMVVDAIFWFHPIVWWMGSRLVEERERACDEEVLRLGGEPQVYAESILKVCEFCLESPLTCVSGVTGSNLKKRIELIMKERFGVALSARKKLLLVAAGVAALAVPVAVGGLTTPYLRDQTPAGQSSEVAAYRPKFKVASIKPSKSGDQGTYVSSPPGGHYTATVPLRSLIASAYLNEFPPKGRLIFGGPDWMDSELFDIEARAEGNPGIEQMHLMVQSLLEERFKLVMHHETRQLPTYELVLAKAGKTGPQLTPHSGDAECTDSASGKRLPQPRPGEAMSAYCNGFFMNPRPGDLRETGNNITMEKLGQFLSQSVDRMVVDRTGLSGAFDFALEFAPELGPGSQPGVTATGSDPSTPPSLFEALQEQLGLKLEPTKSPVDVLVIDRVEKPSEH